jgi:hypothetical protein
LGHGLLRLQVLLMFLDLLLQLSCLLAELFVLRYQLV